VPRAASVSVTGTKLTGRGACTRERPDGSLMTGTVSVGAWLGDRHRDRRFGMRCMQNAGSLVLTNSDDINVSPSTGSSTNESTGTISYGGSGSATIGGGLFENAGTVSVTSGTLDLAGTTSVTFDRKPSAACGHHRSRGLTAAISSPSHVTVHIVFSLSPSFHRHPRTLMPTRGPVRPTRGGRNRPLSRI